MWSFLSRRRYPRLGGFNKNRVTGIKCYGATQWVAWAPMSGREDSIRASREDSPDRKAIRPRCSHGIGLRPWARELQLETQRFLSFRRNSLMTSPKGA